MIGDLESTRRVVILEVQRAAHTIVMRAESREKRRARSKLVRDAARFTAATRRLVRDGTLTNLLAQKRTPKRNVRGSEKRPSNDLSRQSSLRTCSRNDAF